jgi:hypothetical protein
MMPKIALRVKIDIATPTQEIELVEKRLQAAQEHHQTNYENRSKPD